MMMIPILSSVLHFTPDDMRRVRAPLNNQTDGTTVTASLVEAVGAVNPLSYLPGYNK